VEFLPHKQHSYIGAFAVDSAGDPEVARPRGPLEGSEIHDENPAPAAKPGGGGGEFKQLVVDFLFPRTLFLI